MEQYAYGTPTYYTAYLKPHIDDNERLVRDLEAGLPAHTPQLSAEDAKIIRAKPLTAIRTVSRQ